MMAGQPIRRSFSYTQLDSADPEGLSVQTDSQSFHEIKVYNDTKDMMWQLLGELTLTDNTMEMIAIIKQINVKLVRADSIWAGINSSVMLKTQSLNVGKRTPSFEYKGEMKEISKKLRRYINFFEDPESFADQYDEIPEDLAEFRNKGQKAQIEFIQDKIGEIVAEADKKWGEFAARIGNGMPLKIAEEKEMFFRGRRRPPNPVHPR